LAGLAERLTSAVAEKVQRHALKEDELAAAQLLADEKYGTAEWLRKF